MRNTRASRIRTKGQINWPLIGVIGINFGIWIAVFHLAGWI